MPVDDVRRRGGWAVAHLPGQFRAVVFDMDGLLIDSEPLWHRAEQELLLAHGLDATVLDKAATVGMAPREALAMYVRLLGLDRSVLPGLWTDLRTIMAHLYATEMVLLPGSMELVGSLRGRVHLAVASNTDCDLVTLALGAAGLGGAFEVVVSAEEVGRAKPAPDVYVETCRRLGVRPAVTLALEDSPAGVAAAKGAGLTVIAVPQLAGTDVSAADRVIGSLEELLEDRATGAE